MLKEERHQKILDYLTKNKTVTTAFLSEELGVSEVTIRKDLKELEDENVITKIHGGASLVRNNDLPYNIRELTHQKEKEQVAAKAMEFISTGDVIFLDAGTTTYQLCLQIKNKGISPLTVVTNSLQNAYELARTDVDLRVIGGDLRRETLSMIGRDAEAAIQSLRVNKLFLAASGVSLENGITNSNSFEAEIKQHMLNTARQVILVVDSSKLDRVALNRVAELDQIDILITDSGADPEFIGKIEKKTRVVLA